MGDLKAEFEGAVAEVKGVKRTPDNATLLSLYGLFKQATEGDVKGERPDGFEVVAAAKHDAWGSHKGQSRDAAMRAYIALVAKVME